MMLGFQTDIGTVLSILGVVVSVVAWEYRKMNRVSQHMTELRDELQKLHKEHAALLAERDRTSAELVHGLTRAIETMNTGIRELTHYIKWLGASVHGAEPPPPLVSVGRSGRVTSHD
jgi:hypothetical protein